MFYVTQIIGSRSCQQDTYATEEFEVIHSNGTEHMQVFVVADGMGGHSSGEIASRIAVDAFMRSINNNGQWSPQRLISALTAADSSIAQAIAEDIQLSGMGTTLLGVTRRTDTLDWISVGDSLLLLLRGSKLERLNDDHSMLPVLLESVEAMGQKRTKALSDPRRHQLRSALTGNTPKLVDLGSHRLYPQDIVLIASDGLETLDMNELRDLIVLHRENDPEAIAANIINCIIERESLQQDNVTLIIYRHN